MTLYQDGRLPNNFDYFAFLEMIAIIPSKAFSYLRAHDRKDSDP